MIAKSKTPRLVRPSKARDYFYSLNELYSNTDEYFANDYAYILYEDEEGWIFYDKYVADQDAKWVFNERCEILKEFDIYER